MELQKLCMGCMEEKDSSSKCPNCGFVETAAPESPYYLMPRTILQNKYLIGRALGQGGFAITYLAWDINLGIRLAIKEYFPLDLVYRVPGNNLVIAHSKGQDAIFVHDMDKFLSEARMLARFMEHPNIVSVTDFFQANRTAYLVMHYIDGITLRQHLTQNGEKLSFETTMKIMLPVMDALRMVHESGLLHRDISPENIVISQKGRVLLIDFGAARRSAGSREESVSVIMKPGYTPEEQYRSKGVQGPWTDVYAVAATIYRSITGKLPPNSLDRLEHDILESPSQLGIEIEPAAEIALLKALSVASKYRYQSIAEFQAAILQQQYEQPTSKSVDPPKGKTEKKETQKKEQKKVEKSVEEQSTQPDPVPQISEKTYTTLGDINIGRASDNDLVLEDETASRYHARIFSRDGKWYVADLDSTHGTYLNDYRLEEPLELIEPALIRFSETILRFENGNLLDINGNLVRTLNDHVSFTERWFNTERISPNRFIENFIASLDRFSSGFTKPKDLPIIGIGRAPDNDLVLEDDMVSRYHARIFFYQGVWYLADLHSTHGTTVNEIPVHEPIQLQHNDRIMLSSVPITLDSDALISDYGEEVYTLPTQTAFNGGVSTIFDSMLNFFNDELRSSQFWIILISVVGFLAVALLLFLLI